MRIVIVGAGKVGVALASQLIREGHDIVVVDNDRKIIKQIGEVLDCLAIYGNGANVEVQGDADVENSDLLIAVTPMDELNLMCCITARKMGCENTIARLRNPEYAKQVEFLKKEFGLAMTVNPEWSTAREIFRLIQIPGFLQRDSFANGRAELVEFEVKPGSLLDDVKMTELHKRVKVRVLVCAIERGGDVFIPSGSFVLKAGDKIYVTAPAAELGTLVRSLGIRARKSRDIMIIGGSKIAQYLSAMLIKAGARVRVIEVNNEKSLELAEILPDVTIINADGTNQAALKAENIDQMDTVVTLTNMDEENLIVSMYANYIGVPQVITKINRTEYSEVFRDKGIDCVISPKQLCTEALVQYVRARQSTSGSSVITVHHLVDGKAEALEFRVTAETRHIGETLTGINLKPNLLIGCIIRSGKVIIPGGRDTIELGDTVIVVSAAERVIVELNDIFSDGEI